MSLLCITVKKAHYVGNSGQFNSYVTLKLQNVKSTTVAVKGSDPCWEQDFLFETNRVDVGLMVEVWNKGMLWDKFLGCHWIPLTTVQYSNEDGEGKWFSLDSEIVMKDGVLVGTRAPTGHSLLIDARFELPYDLQDAEAADLQRKLEELNTIMDQEITSMKARGLYSAHSEDSDYTSDVNYPVSHPTNTQHPNSSASQFRHATASSLLGASGSVEDPTSRQSSYEQEDDSIERQNSYEYEQDDSYHERRSDSESEPLYYNSRPHVQDRNKSNSWDRDSPVDSRRTSLNVSRQSPQEEYLSDYPEDEYYDKENKPSNQQWNSSSSTGVRRPSLERQSGFDQDHPPTYDDELSDSQGNRDEESEDRDGYRSDDYQPDNRYERDPYRDNEDYYWREADNYRRESDSYRRGDRYGDEVKDNYKEERGYRTRGDSSVEEIRYSAKYQEDEKYRYSGNNKYYENNRYHEESYDTRNYRYRESNNRYQNNKYVDDRYHDVRDQYGEANYRHQRGKEKVYEENDRYRDDSKRHKHQRLPPEEEDYGYQNDKYDDYVEEHRRQPEIYIADNRYSKDVLHDNKQRNQNNKYVRGSENNRVRKKAELPDITLLKQSEYSPKQDRYAKNSSWYSPSEVEDHSLSGHRPKDTIDEYYVHPKPARPVDERKKVDKHERRERPEKESYEERPTAKTKYRSDYSENSRDEFKYNDEPVPESFPPYDKPSMANNKKHEERTLPVVVKANAKSNFLRETDEIDVYTEALIEPKKTGAPYNETWEEPPYAPANRWESRRPSINVTVTPPSISVAPFEESAHDEPVSSAKKLVRNESREEYEPTLPPAADEFGFVNGPDRYDGFDEPLGSSLPPFQDARINRDSLLDSRSDDLKDSFETSDYKDSFDTENKDSFDTEYKDSFETEDTFSKDKDTETDLSKDKLDVDLPLEMTDMETMKVEEETEATTDRPKPTPRERWISAFNKICAQLNVSEIVQFFNVLDGWENNFSYYAMIIFQMGNYFPTNPIF